MQTQQLGMLHKLEIPIQNMETLEYSSLMVCHYHLLRSVLSSQENNLETSEMKLHLTSSIF